MWSQTRSKRKESRSTDHEAVGKEAEVVVDGEWLLQCAVSTMVRG